MKLLRKRRVSAPGCDDAPIIQIGMDDSDRRVTFVYPYYENPRTLKLQIERWSAYSEELRNRLSVIVVDDGSPNDPALGVLAGLSVPFQLRLFRVEVDVRWNWLAARNLGMYQAEGWCVLTDMDHVVPEETLEMLVHGCFSRGTVYRFSRVEHTGEPIAPHPNSWFMTKEAFWTIGGYDEALSGHYGTDGEYRRRVAKTFPIRIMTDHLVRHEFVSDSSTTKYLRKQPEDRAVQAMVSARGPDWKPKTLSFPWRNESL
jgi:hypothetical protein